jgi:hypothetical protein
MPVVMASDLPSVAMAAAPNAYQWCGCVHSAHALYWQPVGSWFTAAAHHKGEACSKRQSRWQGGGGGGGQELRRQPHGFDLCLLAVPP